jgi:hypothetical protein
MNTHGFSLGLIDQECWARASTEAEGKKPQARGVPIEEKESMKWLTALRATHKRLETKQKIVTVTDREGDFFELMQEAIKLKTSFLIRAFRDRSLSQPKELLWERLERQEIIGYYEIEVASKPEKRERLASPRRKATVSVRYARVIVTSPERKHISGQIDLAPMTVTAIFVREENPPQQKEIEPIEWMLLTDLECNGFKEIQEKVRWYGYRWHIESFHRVLKSGCMIEKCRLETAQRLKRYVALKSIIAWRVYWMIYKARVTPEELCEGILATHEWKALAVRIHRDPNVQKAPPTVRQAIRWIAQLGGFLARKGDGEPGMIAIWRGWMRLTDLADMFLLLNPHERCG